MALAPRPSVEYLSPPFVSPIFRSHIPCESPPLSYCTKGRIFAVSPGFSALPQSVLATDPFAPPCCIPLLPGSGCRPANKCHPDPRHKLFEPRAKRTKAPRLTLHNEI